MDELIELLQQIQELAGVGISALEEARGQGTGEEEAPPEGEPPAAEAGPPEEPAA